MPIDDTFQRIFVIIKPCELEECFVNQIKSVSSIFENKIVSVDCKTILGMLKITRKINGKESTEKRYFITSLTDVKSFAEVVRKYWGLKATCTGSLI